MSPAGNERFATAARTGVCPDCDRQVFTPGTSGPAAQILAGHVTTSCTGARR